MKRFISIASMGQLGQDVAPINADSIQTEKDNVTTNIYAANRSLPARQIGFTEYDFAAILHRCHSELRAIV